MFDDQIDEKQQLRAKVKQLQLQISQRARNYMQYSKLKNKSNTNKTVESQSQTDDIPFNEQYDKGNPIQNTEEISPKCSPNPSNQLSFDWGSPHSSNLQNINDTYSLTSQLHRNGIEFKNVAQNKQTREDLPNQHQIVKQILNLFQIEGDSKFEKSKQLSNILNKLQLCEIYKSKEKSDKLREDDLKKIQMLQQETKRLNQKIQIGTYQLKQSQTRCQFITKALNESQQMNYQLRLQGQQCQNKLRIATEMIEKNKIQLYEKTVQQLKLKVSQMQVMKKEYLRAYSKVKQEKDDMQLKLIDIKEELEKIRAKIQSRQEQISSLQHIGAKQQVEEQAQTNFQGQNQEDLRLKTIIQYSEDQVIQQVLKNTSPTNSLTAIKQIIQHGLTETNRSTSEKWIKSALMKLQQFENHQFEQQQKLVEDQQNTQKNIRQNYNNILNNLKKTVIKQKKAIQENFNQAMSKIIKFSNQQKKQQKIQEPPAQIHLMMKKVSKGPRVEEPVINSIKSTDSFDEDSLSIINQDSSPLKQKEEKKDKKQKQDSQTLDLVIKLNQSHQRYGDLKKKYDVLVQKLEQSNSRVVKDFRIEHDFKKFMEKVVANPIKSRNSNLHNYSKFTQQFFDTLSHKIFETLCNLPTGSHGQVYFVPSNQQQLSDAVEVIYRFSLQFDKFQQDRLKQFKKQAESLTKVLEQIAVVNEVSPQMVIQSINHNLDQNNVVAAPFVKSLLKKLSSQRPRKSKSFDDFREQLKKDYQSQMKQGKSQQL